MQNQNSNKSEHDSQDVFCWFHLTEETGQSVRIQSAAMGCRANGVQVQQPSKGISSQVVILVTDTVPLEIVLEQSFLHRESYSLPSSSSLQLPSHVPM